MCAGTRWVAFFDLPYFRGFTKPVSELMAALKNLWPHLVALLAFFLATGLYFSPMVFGDKVLNQGDLQQVDGMKTEMDAYRYPDKTFPLWTNAMFSGMPTYQISYYSKSPVKYASKLSLLGNVMGVAWPPVFLMMACFYLLLITLGVDWRIGIVGSIGYGLAANHMDLIEAGHMTKTVAIAYLPGLLAGVLLTFRGKLLLGGGLTALFMALEVFANHFQITYYFGILLVVLGLVFLVRAIRQHTLAAFAKSAGVLLIAVLLGVASNLGKLWTTYEYAPETIRGSSELSAAVKGDNGYGRAKGESGLSKEYMFSWSYGKLESFNFLIPNYLGGSSQELFVMDPGSATARALRTLPQEQANQLLRATGHYWGDQPFTGGPIYLGVVLFFLFFMGVFLTKGPLRTWIVVGSLLMLFFAWGKNFAAFNYFMADYLPKYSSFRAVSMALGVANFLLALLGVLGVQAFFAEGRPLAERKRGMLLAGATTTALVLLGVVLSFGLDFSTAREAALPPVLLDALRSDRAALLRTDALRSLLFLGLAIGLLWSWTRLRYNATLAVLGIGLLFIADNWGIGRRFIDKDDFVSAREFKNNVLPSKVDEQIMADPDIHYRVADFRRSPYSSAYTSFHHKSIGGYHAAKLMRYQELISNYLNDPGKYPHLFDMLNAKYFIASEDQAQRNPNALGNAWFVERYEIVPDADAEFTALATFDPKTTALVNAEHADALDGLQLGPDPSASIQLTSYHPDELIYTYTANTERLAVFSEIYYPPNKGWEVYLNDEPYRDYFKANFALRALRLPPGQNQQLRMVFRPRAYYTGETIATVSFIIVLVAFLAGLFLYFRKHPVRFPANLPERGPEAAVVAPAAKPTARRRKR